MIRNSRKDPVIKKLLPLVILLASPAFAQSTAEPVVRFTGFLGDLRFMPTDVRADLVGTDDDTRQIAIAMGDAATQAFTQFTTTHVNQSVNLFVCSEQVLSVTIQAPIDTGFAITGPIDADLAVEMVDALNGLQECPN